ncbi:hypothetical protein [Herbidospora sp. NBRC 101105]|uniref:hypothetical protein n=1 Tax=Herbidospora sp. NBRC 101105 TaxID=3032195 RepID=UPI0024A538D2|nr:hypothetical protein [Herbidospora sp. NBRC 101105]GLX99136.1 hypothetical protein Hesp01_70860 [Herbidospora sp. NBRC 101105]
MRTLRLDTATRHLCAGVYLDRTFRIKVLHKVHNDTRHMIAPSYGFNLVPVIRHAWRAWFLEHAQHVAVVLTLSVGFAANPPAVVGVGCVLCVVTVVRLATRQGRELARRQAKAAADSFLHRTTWRSDTEALRQARRIVRLGGWAVLGLLTAPFLLASMQEVHPEAMVRTTLLLLGLLAGVVAVRAAVTQWCMNAMHHADPLDDTPTTVRLADIAAQQDHPVVIYRRPEPPDPEEDDELRLPRLRLDEEEEEFFVGAGLLVHRWMPPLAIQLHADGDGEEKVEFARPPFQASELVTYLRGAMAPIGDADDPTSLPGFQIRDRLYAPEDDVAHRPAWLWKGLDQSEIDAAVDSPYGALHHFLEIRTSATGEIVTTVFLRVTVKGRTLSLDFAATALTRTPREFQILEGHAESGGGAVVRAVLRALAGLPGQVSAAYRLVLAPWTVVRACLARRNGLVRPRRGRTVGPVVSIRAERATDWENKSAFDEVTIQDHVKLIELRLLNCTETFLRGRGVDVSGFSKRAASIINAGILNMGGRVDVKDSAVGPHSQYRNDVRDDSKAEEGAHG